MLILGIESSCDDTSVALLDCSQNGCFVIKQTTASQIGIHKKYGGVVPELAGRAHAEKIIVLLEKILKNQPHPDVIAITSGPGLITGLLVGVESARALSYIKKIPLVAVNHIAGHIHSVQISPRDQKPNKIIYPALSLVVSGGHTELIYIPKQGRYQKLGATLDDAAGECFDKTAQLINLPYPGGPRISSLAKNGNARAIDFPRPMLNQDNYNFSFSGLKTSALYYRQKNPQFNPADFCASLQQAIIDVLVGKTIKAVRQYRPKSLLVVGGVSANPLLRQTIQKQLRQFNLQTNCFLPAKKYCMDNASMIAVAGYYQAKNKRFTPWRKLKADPGWAIA
ncbi:MAG: tRNA (adenosine(37)-N6)-threonylcarbamoyltransferase complex transferase subunit TsaD [Candidatus Magasanikbacteria bacterium CG10_big_fil_rev_8_21_14_0_10_40_10]|uniref:tRNA N6-adenosine threonylcarbamoyltransferase n=1 Tax=Candidatus Magasanikbacteria bacterium CG10_big_fil_rev_8_21_14_0_10_40_10 TaxID=1974648 RepID=A0A2M6W4F2_9BACT|nr:MAG: tRNA (adenosine(37)-N6)-threonylcarbamoyltransferase complex transferase subunit TsaD [Candidatus Magasanikbacteria bacterium CG10_big_fil_rev_8_21_14_0_10_40_10]